MAFSSSSALPAAASPPCSTPLPGSNRSAPATFRSRANRSAACIRPSAISRRVGEWVDLIDLCKEREVRIWVTTHGRLYDPANARDRRTLLEDAVDAEYESDKTSERIRRNVRAAAEAGRPHGKNVYGYQRVYDGKTRELLRVDEHLEQAAIVREAARRVLAGESFYAIAKDFNLRGIPPRRPTRVEHRKNYLPVQKT
ncbi:hypothetical protein BLX87_00960 [Bacillus sp. VT-16-64]|nr:hypothetical protein BLX87_00960 [Bacillus sp. VT-16-64]